MVALVTGVLPQTALYALRAAALFAFSPERTWRAEDLARLARIPAPYLAKVLRKLARNGLLEVRRGQGGGFRLARPPAAITIAEVLGASGWTLNPSTCAFGWGACSDTAPCPLHPAWSRLKEALSHWSESTSLLEALSSPAARDSGRVLPSKKRPRSRRNKPLNA